MQTMLNSGNKHARIISGTSSKLSVQAQKQHIISLWTTFNNFCGVLIWTFNKDTASGVFHFSIHHFYGSKYNQWHWTQVCIRTFENEQTKNERCKENHGRKTNYFIGEYAMS